MVIKTIKILFLILLFAGCSIKNDSVYSMNNAKSMFLGKSENPVLVEFQKAKLEHHYYFRCVDDSYTLAGESSTYGKLFIEYVRLDHNCHWTGLPSGFFISNIRNQLKLDDIEVVENYDIKGYDFSTLKVNKNSYLSVIYIYSSSNDIFILDYKGLLYDKLLKSFKKDYKSKYSNKRRYKGEYNDSLVRKNLLENYFDIEIEDRL